MIKDPLNDSGLAVTQELGFVTHGDREINTLVTTLRHVGGGTISAISLVPKAPDIQKLGAAITYMRRYALLAMFLMVAEDDDANSVMPAKPKREKINFT